MMLQMARKYYDIADNSLYGQNSHYNKVSLKRPPPSQWPSQRPLFFRSLTLHRCHPAAQGWHVPPSGASASGTASTEGASRGSSLLWCMTSDWHFVSGRPLEDIIGYMNMALRMVRDETPGWLRNGQVHQNTATIQKLSDHF